MRSGRLRPRRGVGDGSCDRKPAALRREAEETRGGSPVALCARVLPAHGRPTQGDNQGRKRRRGMGARLRDANASGGTVRRIPRAAGRTGGAIVKGFRKGDPRAVAAGRKGGKTMRYKLSPEYRAGYQAGYKAGQRTKEAA